MPGNVGVQAPLTFLVEIGNFARFILRMMAFSLLITVTGPDEIVHKAGACGEFVRGTKFWPNFLRDSSNDDYVWTAYSHSGRPLIFDFWVIGTRLEMDASCICML